MKTAIITGAGGFIGSHLAKFLKKKGYFVTGIDIKKPEFSKTAADKFIIADLRDPKIVKKHLYKVDELYMLAADMGGMGFISCNGPQIVHNNAIINLNLLHRSAELRIGKVFFSSSACAYPEEKQLSTKNSGLKEQEAYPANPDTAYGWEKIFTEQTCMAYHKELGLKIAIARFHNIYGPEGTYEGGREKSPAALCRKIAMAKKTDSINVWGDGKQTRSYCYIDDCLEGIFKLMQSDYDMPLNIGSDRLVTINKMVDIIAKIAKKKISKHYDLSKPQGVRGRNSDNTLIKKTLEWSPKITIEEGLEKTYKWIDSQLKKNK
ncbi:MAG: NAD-dependent epimerase/dehydratase family protein [Pseudomonadales bacterium]|nr:NAD-dependent epimerase/dehydratase family protein [Pseudomonadales bacterium]